MWALEEETGSHLPHGMSVINTYTKTATRSKRVAVMMKNLTTALITITKGVQIAQVIAANAIPQVGVTPGMLKKLNEMQRIQRVRMSAEHRKEALLQQMDLSDLEGWSTENWAATHALLAEYHDTFSLEPWELDSYWSGETEGQDHWK